MTDREKIVEILKQACRFSCGEEYCKHHHERCVGRSADFLIANGVTFATDTNVGSKWISVEDRLPENGRYLVFQKSFISGGHCDFATFTQCYSGLLGDPMNGKQLWYKYDGEYGDYEVTNVTHWMPLPKPPKED
jgi:hypothetical protein